MANVAWAFANLGVRNETLLSGLAAHLLTGQRLSRCSARDVATVAWAFAALGFRNETLMAAIEDAPRARASSRRAHRRACG